MLPFVRCSIFPASARRLHICHHRHGITGEVPCRITVKLQRSSMMSRNCVRSCVVRKHDIQKVSHTAGRICHFAVPGSSVRNRNISWLSLLIRRFCSPRSVFRYRVFPSHRQTFRGEYQAFSQKPLVASYERWSISS